MNLESDDDDSVEVDPTGRYTRYNEVLGKGASKIVYRAFDEYEGIEVAWNQVKLYNFLQSPEDLQRLYNEIHLLKTLEHNNIMKFYSSWVDTSRSNINFVTEMFTSGTLRQFRQKHKRVNIRAVKNWCRQILKGLLYLHSHDPPVIHRDLKCDNIFINGNHGEVKIGDLGLAAMLSKSDAAHCVGTPEFMAPEVYEEEYNELVDIYAFGMCVLEMVTFEYPYSECNHPAEIYKKVISGRKPDALYKVRDPEVRRFVEKCLVTVSGRLSARELLMDPFLQIDDGRAYRRLMGYLEDIDEMGPITRQPLYQLHHNNNSFVNQYPYDFNRCLEVEDEWRYYPSGNEQNEIELFTNNGDEYSSNLDISIKGKKREDDSIYLRLRITDNEVLSAGCIRNIYFPFDIENDTALSVATEMVGELEITDQDVTNIADMIDGEIASLVPGWTIGPGIIETPRSFPHGGFCFNCASNRTSTGSLVAYLPLNNDGANNLLALQCSQHGCAAMHGRFEEITYAIEGSMNCLEEATTPISSHSDEQFDCHESPEVSSLGSRVAHCDDEPEQFVQSTFSNNDPVIDKNIISISNQDERNSMLHSPDSGCSPTYSSPVCIVSDDYDKEIRQELRWLKARYQLELRELRSKQLERKFKTSTVSLTCNHGEQGTTENSITCSPVISPKESGNSEWKPFSADAQNCCPNAETQNAVTTKPFSPEDIFTAKSFYTGALLPRSLHRTTSLPVDAVDI